MTFKMAFSGHGVKEGSSRCLFHFLSSSFDKDVYIMLPHGAFKPIVSEILIGCLFMWMQSISNLKMAEHDEETITWLATLARLASKRLPC